MTTKCFIDTEFTNFPPAEHELISLGLAAENGEEFYAEAPYEINHCSEFVHEVVIPLLGRIPHEQVSLDDLRGRILDWLQLVRRNAEDVVICYDSEYDWNLFIKALDYRVPAWCQKQFVGNEINEMLRYDFHMKNGLPEHHALYDACANRHAYRPRPEDSPLPTRSPFLA
jgi:hypothetical protein